MSEIKPTFAIIVGEHSGDTLGAGLVKELQQRYPNARFIGIGGPKMNTLGFESLFSMEELAVMGIVEVLGRLRRLMQVRKSIVNYFSEHKPDVFIGIDAPDFNLTVEEKLKLQGIKTVHYVSPSVWAWREKRIFKIDRATDMVLSLLPFEKDFYDQHDVACTFVGHPLADDIPLYSDQAVAREKLQLAQGKKYLAIMPGSRSSELAKLLPDFLATAQILIKQHPDLQLIAPVINDVREQQFIEIQQQTAPELDITIFNNDTQLVMAAADCLLSASGTVTLEGALIKRPMVVAYKFNWLTAIVGRIMVKLKWFSLPNLMAQKTLLPELLQEQVTPENLANEVEPLLFQDQSELLAEFEKIHLALKQNASEKAADAVEKLLNSTNKNNN
ncbi:lipid-A-disaccharide synthase [Thalassotalea sp. ND16A]|uniref:lipid-A-disaccharide synthase n=1 Tax=Thalassotalea sp. ND16A TaxID=1535422 RepID=UPI00051A5212|nr:lipid-A-disaccharide synthase [Thalassotalea sp. ND16A]KGJ91062.1 Lipid-A-disaccharide synthase [Thalassotalea sp. ND16A]